MEDGEWSKERMSSSEEKEILIPARLKRKAQNKAARLKFALRRLKTENDILHVTNVTAMHGWEWGSIGTMPKEAGLQLED
ncbi:hypothetical protein LTR28_007060 [Elasticomyces elasticus]|nr:hypothetical protein LTR28_007060 [Elasticomyces elasticus]